MGAGYASGVHLASAPTGRADALLPNAGKRPRNARLPAVLRGVHRDGYACASSESRTAASFIRCATVVANLYDTTAEVRWLKLGRVSVSGSHARASSARVLLEQQAKVNPELNVNVAIGMSFSRNGPCPLTSPGGGYGITSSVILFPVVIGTMRLIAVTPHCNTGMYSKRLQ